MPSPQRVNLVDGLVEDFVDLIRPTREAKNKIDGADFLSMIWRMARALEFRTIEDITLIPQVVALAQRFAEIANVAIAVNAARFACDPMRGASMKECARAMGISAPSASERRKAGDVAIFERLKAANVLRIDTVARLREQQKLNDQEIERKAAMAARRAESQREGAAIAAAEKYAVANLGEYRARHRQRAA